MVGYLAFTMVLAEYIMFATYHLHHDTMNNIGSEVQEASVIPVILTE